MPSNYRKSAYKNPIFPKTNKAERMQLSGAITKMTGIEVPADVRRNRGARFATEAMQTSNSEDATGNSSNQTAAKAKGAGRRGSGRRGGRGGARERGNRKPLTKESLDSELDGYMMKDSTTGKNILDKELDAYMQDITPNAGADL